MGIRPIITFEVVTIMGNEHICKPKVLKNFPSIEFFLPDDNEYDSEETLDFLGYDLVEMLDEINVEQNEVIIDDNEMEKVDDVISEEEYDNDAIIYDDVNNLQKRKRKQITPKLVRCKCGKEIRLDRDFRDKNLTTHGELSNCKYSGEGQQSIEVFFKPKKIRYEEENTIVQKVACKGLYEEKYREYVLNSPAEFGGSVRPDIAAKELFPETIKTKLRLKSLSTANRDDLKNYLCACATWILDKTSISVRSKACENFTIRESGICDNCDQLRRDNRLIKAINKRRATGKNIRFIPKCYLEHPLSKLLLNTNLKSLWVSADEDNDNTAIWTKLAQFGKDGFFKGEKTFQELFIIREQS
ncbi:unnamed protein product [Rhizophagus irregularis]|nr:unnamed protein product [Rhizophagus irregularis]